MIVLCSAAAALTGATAAALWRGLARPLAAAGAYAVAVLAAGAITANRYDVAVALTLAACLFFLARRHTTAAGAALGVGVALKLTPGMLLPLVLIVAETRRRVLYALAGFLVFMIVPFVPFLGRFHGLTNIITYHAQRPLQIESVPGTPYLIAGAMGKWGIGTGTSFGSQSLAGPGSHLVARLSVWVGLLLVAGVYVLVWRRRALLRAAPEYIPARRPRLRPRLHRLQQGALAAVPLLDVPAGGAGRGRQGRLPARDRHPDAGRHRPDPGRVPAPLLADGRPRVRVPWPWSSRATSCSSPPPSRPSSQSGSCRSRRTRPRRHRLHDGAFVMPATGECAVPVAAADGVRVRPGTASGTAGGAAAPFAVSRPSDSHDSRNRPAVRGCSAVCDTVAPHTALPLAPPPSHSLPGQRGSGEAHEGTAGQLAP